MAEMTIKYDAELVLGSPRDNAHPVVDVDVEPKDGGCLIWGTGRDGLKMVEVRGSKTGLQLPFVQAKVFIKHLMGTTSVKITTTGWQDFALDDGR